LNGIAFVPFPIIVLKNKGCKFFSCNASRVSCNLGLFRRRRG